MQLKDLKKINLPDKPGVYFFKKGKNILYIGKATFLRDRVKSYFGKDLIATRGPMILDMVFQADKIDLQETDSVLEALILEAELIKKYQPFYNTKEKSDKSFNYVCITKEDLPKVIIKRGKDLKKELFYKVFGPFPNSSQLKEALKIIRRIFPFLDERSKNYIDFYRQINLVPDLNDKKMYKQNIKNIILFFSGKKQQILKNLYKEMNAYAKLNQFEKSGEIKRQIFSLKHINDVALIKEYGEEKNFGKYVLGVIGQGTHFSQNLSPRLPFRIEAYDIAHMSGKNMVGVVTVIENGEIAKKEYKKFIIKTQSGANDTGALAEIISRRLNHMEWGKPNLIVVDGGVAQINIARKITMVHKLKISIVGVVKDERHKAKMILGDEKIIKQYKKYILLANMEAHRFAITFHRLKNRKNFLVHK